MKYALALALTCAAFTTNAAGIIMTMPNKGGGMIELTDLRAPEAGDSDPCKNRYIAKSWGNFDDVIGCYMASGASETVNIYWIEFSAYRTYRISDFTTTEYGQKTYGGKK